MRDLEPHQIDVIGLALVAIGIFLSGVAYGFWAGGSLGHGILSGLELLIGKLAYLTPIVLVLGGARIVARDLDVAPATRPLRSGTICLLVALALAFAAGVFGPGRTPSTGFWSGAVMKPRGGLLGGAEYYVVSHLISTAGADILAVFLLIAGVILLSGATFASVISRQPPACIGVARPRRVAPPAVPRSGRRACGATGSTRMRSCVFPSPVRPS